MIHFFCLQTTQSQSDNNTQKLFPLTDISLVRSNYLGVGDHAALAHQLVHLHRLESRNFIPYIQITDNIFAHSLLRLSVSY